MTVKHVRRSMRDKVAERRIAARRQRVAEIEITEPNDRGAFLKPMSENEAAPAALNGSHATLQKTIVTWLWKGPNLSKRSFIPAHVNALQRSIANVCRENYRFVCITDETHGFDKDVDVIPTPASAQRLATLITPERRQGADFPSCYRRLWMFSEEAKVLGDRALLIDIDLVPVRDWAPLFARSEDFVGWRPYRDWGERKRFGGGIYLLTPGSRAHVWDEFNGAPSIQRARAAGYRGSDQAWISYKLGEREPHYGREAGIYSIRDFLKGRTHHLPNDATLIQFNGPMKPWSAEARAIPWVREFWR